MCRSNYLSEDHQKILGTICSHVENIWSKRKGIPVYFTLHDASHSKGVEEAIYKLIPDKSILKEEEWFYLISAAWLHDIGMIPDLQPLKNVSHENARKDHHSRSKEYITSDPIYQSLGLGHNDATIIGDICYYHRRSEDINLCKDEPELRMKLLASYLRLADSIHINTERTEDSLFKIFLEIGMPIKSKFHWMKSFCVKKVVPNQQDHTIEIILNIKEKEVDNVEIIRKKIEEDILSEIAPIKEILISNGTPYYLNVKSIYGRGLEIKKKIYLSQVINNLQLEAYPSATDVANSFINTILFISDPKNFEDYWREAYRNIKVDQIKMVEKIMEARPSHFLVRRIYKIVIDNIETDPDNIDDNDIKDKLNRLHREMINIKEYRDKRLNKLYEDGKSLFNDPGAILLFGHSKLVVNVLKRVDPNNKEKIKIYICEGKNVCQYNDMNELKYCDGIEYARNIKEAGYNDITLIPDILVENLMKRKLIEKVAFGANGVDYESGNFYHTAGHGTIAQLAKINGIPIYVIVDSLKIGDVKEYYRENTIRATKWIAGYEKSYPELKIESYNFLEDEPTQDKTSRLRNPEKKDQKLVVKLYNPREDEIEQDKVLLLITDFGIFPPNQLKSRIEKKEFLIDPKFE